MNDFYKFANRFRNEPLDKIHILFKLFGRGTEAVVVISAVNEVFGGKAYAAFRFKVFD